MIEGASELGLAHFSGTSHGQADLQECLNSLMGRENENEGV